MSSGQTQAVTDTHPVPAITHPQPRSRAQRRARRRAHWSIRRKFLIVGLALVTAAALAYAVSELLPHSPAVTIRVDGKQRVSAETGAKTVATVLREHHVKTGAEDRVTPGPGR